MYKCIKYKTSNNFSGKNITLQLIPSDGSEVCENIHSVGGLVTN